MVTNDPINPETTLIVSGDIENVYSLSQKRIHLSGPANTNIRQTVLLSLEKKYPFVVTGVRAKKGENIQFQIEDVKEGDAGGYELTVENVKKQAGKYSDIIYLETDSDVQPEIKVSVIGVIEAPGG